MAVCWEELMVSSIGEVRGGKEWRGEEGGGEERSGEG